MNPVVLAMPGNDAMGRSLAEALGIELGDCNVRRFPDGESYVRIDAPMAGRSVVIVCTLDRPDDKFVPLAFLARTARELGAARVGLACPYLPYMRQDARFHPGEAVSARLFAELLGPWIDWLVTVDPHLHRLHTLDDVFAVPVTVVQAAPALSEWIRSNVPDPFVIGPDSESEQWVASVASEIGAPFAVLRKSRRGDRDVVIEMPDEGIDVDRTPVLVDDIISTAGTMIEAVRRLRASGAKPPVCLGVHAVFADGADAALRAVGAARIVTCNTIAHRSNAVDLVSPIADAVLPLLHRAPPQ